MSDNLDEFVVVVRKGPLARSYDKLKFVGQLPLDGAFFGSINLSERRRLVKKESLDIVEEEILRIHIREVEPVVIDDLRLFLQPAGPAWLADLLGDPLPEFIGKGRETYCRTFVTTVYALNVVCHSFSPCEGL